MLCAQCHTSNSIDYNFCRECGVRLEGDPAADPRTEQLLARAFAHLDQGQYQDARDAALAALALDPDGVSAHSIMGLAYEREGKVPEAIREYETVLRRSPNSTADRLKLAALRGNRTGTYVQRRLSTRQIVLASAAAAAVAVFGGGYLVMTQLSQPAQRQASHGGAGARSTGSLTPNTATAAGVGSPRAIRPLLPLPTPPSPLAAGAQPPGAPAPARPPAIPVMPTSGARQFSPTLRPSAPIGPLTLPGPGDRSASASAAGLAPAGIGEVVPIPNAPATAPGGPAIIPGIPGGPVPAPTAGAPTPAPAPPAPTVGASAAPHDGDAPNEKPKRELLEPETGFIRIEPFDGGKEPRGAVGAPKGAPPTISVSFAATEAESATLGDAQRAHRGGLSERQSDPAEAERRLRQAIGLYEILVRRGGSLGRQARVGLDECRKALAALR